MHKMGMAEDAFYGLWDDKQMDYDFSINYSGRFRGYNANIRQCGRKVIFSLSKNWRPISRDIKIGLMQELLAKLLREKKTTPNIDLYHIFMKKVHIAVPKTDSDPELEKSFERVNESFFSGMMERPNLKWCQSTIKLGSYDYGADTITITEMLKGEDLKMLDYVMYHEMLHKKHKFNSKGGKLKYHTKEFRSSERVFPNSESIERNLRLLRPRKVACKRKPRSRLFRLFLPLF